MLNEVIESTETRDSSENAPPSLIVRDIARERLPVIGVRPAHDNDLGGSCNSCGATTHKGLRGEPADLPNKSALRRVSISNSITLLCASCAALLASELAAELVPGEKDATTREALALYYDAKRDKQVEVLARLCGQYGQEVEKRGDGMTSAHAAPLLVEMRSAITRAESAQRSAKLHREAM